MSKTLEQIAYDVHERRFDAIHGHLPRPEPYPTTDGIEVEEHEVDEGMFVAACGGSEQPFTVDGVRWLYVWNRTTRQHGYYNMDLDIVYTDPNFHPCQPVEIGSWPEIRSPCTGGE